MEIQGNQITIIEGFILEKTIEIFCEFASLKLCLESQQLRSLNDTIFTSLIKIIETQKDVAFKEMIFQILEANFKTKKGKKNPKKINFFRIF